MDITLINKLWGGVCVYRQRVKRAQFVVQSIYLQAGRTSYSVSVEFDSLKMVEQGEGIRWGADSDNLDLIIESLESFIKKPVSEWVPQTKIQFYDSEVVTDEHYQNSFKVLKEKYQSGKLLLPKGLPFVMQTIEMDTPQERGWAIARSRWRRPHKKKRTLPS